MFLNLRSLFPRVSRGSRRPRRSKAKLWSRRGDFEVLPLERGFSGETSFDPPNKKASGVDTDAFTLIFSNEFC